MGEEEKRILNMLADGRITADEAHDLLTALGPVGEAEDASGHALATPTSESANIEEIQPDLQRFRRLWRIPFFIAAGALLLSGLGLFLMYQSTADVAALGFLCIWSIFIVALLATLMALVARRSTWLYLRVEESDGARFAFGMPMPLNLMGWSLKIARLFVPTNQRARLETAAVFVSAMQDDPDAAPIFIDVDDEDDKVQIYIG
jgi:hypothetical protein